MPRPPQRRRSIHGAHALSTPSGNVWKPCPASAASASTTRRTRDRSRRTPSPARAAMRRVGRPPGRNRSPPLCGPHHSLLARKTPQDRDKIRTLRPPCRRRTRTARSNPGPFFSKFALPPCPPTRSRCGTEDNRAPQEEQLGACKPFRGGSMNSPIPAKYAGKPPSEEAINGRTGHAALCP